MRVNFIKKITNLGIFKKPGPYQSCDLHRVEGWVGGWMGGWVAKQG